MPCTVTNMLFLHVTSAFNVLIKVQWRKIKVVTVASMKLKNLFHQKWHPMSSDFKNDKVMKEKRRQTTGGKEHNTDLLKIKSACQGCSDFVFIWLFKVEWKKTWPKVMLISNFKGGKDDAVGLLGRLHLLAKEATGLFGCSPWRSKAQHFLNVLQTGEKKKRKTNNLKNCEEKLTGSKDKPSRLV